MMCGRCNPVGRKNESDFCFLFLSPHCNALIKLNTMYLPLLSIITKIQVGKLHLKKKKQGKWHLEHRKGERDRLSQSVSLMPRTLDQENVDLIRCLHLLKSLLNWHRFFTFFSSIVKVLYTCACVSYISSYTCGLY